MTNIYSYIYCNIIKLKLSIVLIVFGSICIFLSCNSKKNDSEESPISSSNSLNSNSCESSESDNYNDKKLIKKPIQLILYWNPGENMRVSDKNKVKSLYSKYYEAEYNFINKLKNIANTEILVSSPIKAMTRTPVNNQKIFNFSLESQNQSSITFANILFELINNDSYKNLKIDQKKYIKKILNDLTKTQISPSHSGNKDNFDFISHVNAGDLAKFFKKKPGKDYIIFLNSSTKKSNVFNNQTTQLLPRNFKFFDKIITSKKFKKAFNLLYESDDQKPNFIFSFAAKSDEIKGSSDLTFNNLAAQIDVSYGNSPDNITLNEFNHMFDNVFNFIATDNNLTQQDIDNIPTQDTTAQNHTCTQSEDIQICNEETMEFSLGSQIKAQKRIVDMMIHAESSIAQIHENYMIANRLAKIKSDILSGGYPTVVSSCFGKWVASDNSTKTCFNLNKMKDVANKLTAISLHSNSDAIDKFYKKNTIKALISLTSIKPNYLELLRNDKSSIVFPIVSSFKTMEQKTFVDEVASAYGGLAFDGSVTTESEWDNIISKIKNKIDKKSQLPSVKLTTNTSSIHQVTINDSEYPLEYITLYDSNLYFEKYTQNLIDGALVKIVYCKKTP